MTTAGHRGEGVRRVTRLKIGLLILLCGLAGAFTSPLRAAELMLPQVYHDQVEVVGWLMSEKLDGVRGYWDGQQLWSKHGTLLSPPAEFIRDLPPFPLDGELWGGRGSFEQTLSIVSQQQPHPGWRQLRFAIFDVPHAGGGFRQRIEQARSWFREHPSPFAFVIPQIPVRDRTQLQRELARVEGLGGEGLIVRQPDARYAAGRSATILKLKSYLDAEAKVLAQLPGKGRNAGRLGSLLVEQADGLQFRIGTGFSDAERDNPPPVGSLITFKYYGRYRSGIPKFPSYLRVRGDAGL